MCVGGGGEGVETASGGGGGFRGWRGVEDTLPTEGDTAIAAFNYSVACYIHQCRNNGSHQRGDEGAHHSPYINTYIYIYIYTCNYHHCRPPPHSASCSSASGVSVPVGGRKKTTSASCNG